MWSVYMWLNLQQRDAVNGKSKSNVFSSSPRTRSICYRQVTQLVRHSILNQGDVMNKPLSVLPCMNCDSLLHLCVVSYVFFIKMGCFLNLDAYYLVFTPGLLLSPQTCTLMFPTTRSWQGLALQFFNPFLIYAYNLITSFKNKCSLPLGSNFLDKSTTKQVELYTGNQPWSWRLSIASVTANPIS